MDVIPNFQVVRQIRASIQLIESDSIRNRAAESPVPEETEMRDSSSVLKSLTIIACLFGTMSDIDAAQNPGPPFPQQPATQAGEKIDSANSIGLTVADGFSVRQVAGDELATNIFSLTISAEGSVLVSGPGYIKRLVDENRDGVFDSARWVSRQLRSGAQGMCVDQGQLYAVGDGAVWRFDLEDPERPGQAMLKIKTGGEHDAHAIRKGPFGWWYLIAGNGVPIRPEFLNSSHSPIKNPRAGFLMRISPDWKERQVLAHGFRNAYDFDISSEGRIFVYDSDGERDVSLPWYRPTRLFEVLPGDDAGFVTTSWKRPDHYFDMPKLIDDAGRGSPTGVTVFDGGAFGSEFENAVFIADWTFGRILVAQQNRLDKSYGSLKSFVSATGEFGFAVTDMEQDRDGSLLVTVGGRGTQGGVYRIFRTASQSANRARNADGVEQTTQPDLGRIPADSRFAKAERRMFPPGRWSDDHEKRLMRFKSSPTFDLTTAASLVGRAKPGMFEVLANARFDMADADARRQLRRFTIRFAQGKKDVATRGQPSLISKQAAWRQQLEELLEVTASADPELSIWNDSAELLDKIRAHQIELAPTRYQEFPAVLHGYVGRQWFDSLPGSLAQPLDGAAWVSFRNISLMASDLELREFARLLAMWQISSPEIRNAIAKRLRPDSDPVDDLFWLCCLARVSDAPYIETGFTRGQIASALLSLESKFRALDLPRDRNWKPRVRELLRVLFRDVELVATIAGHPEFGSTGHALLASEFRGASQKLALKRLVGSAFQGVGEWDLDLAELLVREPAAVPRSWIRKMAEQSEYYELAVRGLSRQPEAKDEALLIRGLGARNQRTVADALQGLVRLKLREPGRVAAAAWKKLSQLNSAQENNPLQDRLVHFLRQKTGWQLGFEMGQPGQQQNQAIERWFDKLAEQFPEEFASLGRDAGAEQTQKALSQVNWKTGDLRRGQNLFRKLQCATCHNGGSRLGPDLSGVSRRFSNQDLVEAIVNPDRQVAMRYRATIVETSDGMIYRGSMIYDSVDGITLMIDSGETIRINRDNIEEKRISNQSVMPKGLLEQATRQDIADLVAYLKSL